MTQRKPTGRVPLWIGWTLAGATALLGVGLIAAQIAPTTPTPMTPLLVGAREARADALAPTDPTSALKEVEAGLALAPTAATSWLRITDLEARRSGALTPRAVEALERSYDAAPLGPDVTAWRLTFLFERWRELPPGMRAHALAEMRVWAARKGSPAPQMVETLRDPAGRLAAQMALDLARSPVARKSTNSVIRQPQSRDETLLQRSNDA